MRVVNLDGRAALLIGDDAYIDVATASDGRLPADPQALFDDWASFSAWAATAPVASAEPMDGRRPGPPVPRPRQVFAIGMNYRDHAAEIGVPVPETLSVFTKFSTCLAGAFDAIPLPEAGQFDWEVEIVAVIGRHAWQIDEADAWDHVAGLTVGQDLTDRRMQNQGAMPQFSLAKSLPGFGPTGPWLVTPDELDDPDDLRLGCSVNGEVVQSGSSRNLVFGIAELVARLSRVVPLVPGDLLFTGTPAGVGAAQTPPASLSPGDLLESWIDGVGRMRNVCEPAAGR
ncbi:MAG TPA: fumarylacetoacetate hydrolase family protein [Baekduia sp.]|nr:fumarylacetoacetate hydrolase family protein [Baekduia sp.]